MASRDRMPWRLRASGDGQLVLLRRGCLALALMFCATSALSAAFAEWTPVERAWLLSALVVLVAACVAGYRRGAFGPVLRIVIVGTILGLAPVLGSMIMGAAWTANLLLALYPGRVARATPVLLAFAAALGEIVEPPVDPGNLIGATTSIVMIAFILGQLRGSVTERDELQRKLERQVGRDPLTGLPNRRVFHQRVCAAAAHQERTGIPYAVLMADLDGFKDVNDTYGHEIGDEVLIAVAQRMVACMRPSDFCARLGGDELVVLVEDCANRAQAEAIAERLREAIVQPIELGDLSLRILVSIGLSWNDEDPESALREADRAMYTAKLQSSPVPHARGQLVFTT